MVYFVFRAQNFSDFEESQHAKFKKNYNGLKNFAIGKNCVYVNVFQFLTENRVETLQKRYLSTKFLES